MENELQDTNDGDNEEIPETKPAPKKRGRIFFAAEFRKSLSTKNGHESIKNFVQLCSEENGTQDYALEYIESGGNCSELLRVLEASDNKNASFALPVFQAFNIILLKILSSYPHKQLAGEEACRELLNKYYASVKAMLSLNSNSKQRKVALKLLSTIATMSVTLAKEVLAHTSFDRSILEVLTQPTTFDVENSVRTSFIHFLISFLIEGNSPTIITFLEKRGLLGSIFNGLLYDKPDTIELVLSTIQSKILENKSISKTMKMNTFNTQAVRNIVNLYNWKGPSNWKPNNKKKSSPVVSVDTQDKEKVSDSAHRFLLVLCTSHRYGIIFHDPTIGLGSAKHNPLMMTVLQSLEKPWDHERASELVIKICVACPDLVKFTLTNVEPFLEPRVSQKWTNAIKFVKQLIQSLTPQCVEQFLPQLNIKQISIVIQTFCVPKEVLQSISSETISHDHIGIRHESVLLLNIMFESIENYLSAVDKIASFTSENKSTLKGLIIDYLNKNLPTASVILCDWRKSVTPTEELLDPSVAVPEVNEHLSKILDILYKYNITCSSLVDNITKEIDTNEFLQTIERVCGGKDELTAEMQLKAINLLLISDKSLFLPTTDLFSYTLPLLLKLYLNATGTLQINIESTLCNLFSITGIFEGCSQEILVWLYALLEQNSYNEEIGIFFVLVFKKACKNFLKYLSDLSSLKESIVEEFSFNITDIIESFQIDSNHGKRSGNRIFHVTLSPFVMGVLDTLMEVNSEEVLPYLNIAFVHLLYLQTAPNLLSNLLLQEKYNKVLDKHVIKYYKSWQKCTNLLSLKRIYNSSTITTKLSKYLASDNEEDILNVFDTNEWRHYYSVLLTKLLMFYFTQLSSKKMLTKPQQQKYLQSVIYLINKCDKENTLTNCLEAVFKHPTLLTFFTATYQSKHTIEILCTDFILDIIKELTKCKTKTELEPYLTPYQSKLVTGLHIMLKKCGKHNKAPNSDNFIDIVKLLDLSHEQCQNVLKMITNLPSSCMISTDSTPSSIVDLLTYILNQNQLLQSVDNRFIPFPNEFFAQLGQHLIYLNRHKAELNLEILETSLYSYIKRYPHCTGSLSIELFESLLLKSNVSKSSARLAMLFLRCNPKLLDAVSKHLDNIIEKRELMFSVLHAVIDCNSSLTTTIQEQVYKKHEPMILKFLNKPQKVANYLIDNYAVVVRLVKDCMDLETCNNFASKSHKFDITEIYHAEILSAVYNKSIMSETADKFKYVTNYITTSMHLLINALKKADKSEEDWITIEKVTKMLCSFVIKMKNVYKIEYSDENLCKSASFQTFSKLCLKFGLQGRATLVNVLKQLCKLTSSAELGILFEMAIGHSESLNILLSNSDVKVELISLLLVICKTCPSVMSKAHIPVWLGAYQATLSPSDQYLLQLLSLYEEANIGFHEYKPYLWDKAAVGHYSVRFGVETALWRQPKPKEVLDILDENKIKHTITNFPRSRKLQPDQPLYYDGETDVYDPAFYLPLLSQLLVPESTIRWYQCTQRGILALVIVSLTSEDPEIRSAACLVLARFHHHIESVRSGKDRLLWCGYVEGVCRGASMLSECRLSSLAAVFVSRCALAFTRPSPHLLYTPLAHYFVAKEWPDFTVVPELLPLLHSTDTNCTLHRHFILETIRDGLCTQNDLQVMFRSVAFKFIMDLYNSVLIDHESKRIILEILASAVSVPTASRILTSGYSLLSWLHTVIAKSNSNQTDLLIAFIDILHNLVASYDDGNFKNIQFNVLLSLLTIITILKDSRLELVHLRKYIKTLYRVYECNPRIISKDHLNDLINICLRYFDCNICSYYLEYGSDYVKHPVLDSDEITIQCCYYLKLLTLKWIETNKKS